MGAKRTNSEIMDIAKEFLCLTDDIKAEFCHIGAGDLCFVREITHLELELPNVADDWWYSIINFDDGSKFLVFDWRFDQAHNFIERYTNSPGVLYTIPGNVYGGVVFSADDIRNFPANKEQLFKRSFTEATAG